MDDAVERYLTELAQIEHDDPVLVDMEVRAKEHGFPIVGRATGRERHHHQRAADQRCHGGGEVDDQRRHQIQLSAGVG